jgi:hypothetical protein
MTGSGVFFGQTVFNCRELAAEKDSRPLDHLHNQRVVNGEIITSEW